MIQLGNYCNICAATIPPIISSFGKCLQIISHHKFKIDIVKSVMGCQNIRDLDQKGIYLLHAFTV